MDEQQNQTYMMPLIALRDLTVFPGMLLSFECERQASIATLNASLAGNHLVFIASQKDPDADTPTPETICRVGTVCRIRQQVRLGNGACRVMVEGLHRAGAARFHMDSKIQAADISDLPDLPEKITPARLQALTRKCMELFEKYVQVSPDLSGIQLLNLVANPEEEYLAYYIAQNMALPVQEKQEVLEELHSSKRMLLVLHLLTREVNILTIERELEQEAVERMNDNQREYWLREEMKILREELGEDETVDDFDAYREKIAQLPVSDETKETLNKEVSKLSKQPFGSSDAAVIRGYLDTCLDVPWGKRSKECSDIRKARKILDEDHYGLDKVKQRVIEYLAMRSYNPEIKGGLICLVGPPGTGKTSIAMSVARCCNRKLVRVSLGGVHDEAEIRGHRKTYVGSMPGRIINGLIQAKTMNPVMVLDEVDKLGSDYKGDPASALLEALDPEQNSSFRDHFLEIPVDLSEVFFITTANTVETIPVPLLDRMEVIELSSYTDEEKLMIAKQHLVPKQRKKHGISGNCLRFRDDAIRAIVSDYTRESGVRQLERQIARICRKTVAGILEERITSANVAPSDLKELLGVPKYRNPNKPDTPEVGLVKGLAYTSVGGEMLDVEAVVMEGTGKVEFTGNLGDVMKESVRTAVSVIRSHASILGIDTDFYKTKDIHIHFPEGAVPKDGPSAGVTICTALFSALSGVPVRQDLAMTGEITLRGRVTAIGGLREKTMGALRSGVHCILVPEENRPDLEEIDPLVREKLSFVFASDVLSVLRLATGESFPRERPETLPTLSVLPPFERRPHPQVKQ